MADRVLVTGGSGFLARFCLRTLDRAGYALRTTVRNPQSRERLLQSLAEDAEMSGIPEIHVADLTSDEGWAEAVSGCNYVLHTAAPVLGNRISNDDAFEKPIVEGTIRLLRLARDATVRRVVITSSSATICYGHRVSLPVYDETHWSDTSNRKGITPYGRAKTLAEQAAWKWFAEENGRCELTTIQPGVILGPVWDSDYSPSISFVSSLLDGSSPGYADLGYQIVDARDLADLHLLAMTHPAASGQRFLGTGEFLWMRDVASILRDRLPDRPKIPARRVPNWVLRLVALGNPLLRETLFELGKERRCPATKAEKVLGWASRPAAETVADTAESLFRLQQH